LVLGDTHGASPGLRVGGVTQSGTPESPKCSSARRGLRYYRGVVSDYRARMGRDTSAAVTTVGERQGRQSRPCSVIRRAAKFWQGKAIEWRKRYESWRDEWDWRAWLPAKWYRIARCETGVRWDWNSGTYQGAFGFWYGTWDAYKPRGAPSEAYLATPRQQYLAALNVYAAHGYGAWGCGSA
jgi:Transglycosylase-like domain